MVTIRRKHKSFTVVCGNERYIGKRREGAYHILSDEQVVIILEYDMKSILKVSGMEEFSIQRVPSDREQDLRFETKLNDRYYTLLLPEEGHASLCTPLGTEVFLDEDARCQEIQQKIWPLGLAILYGIYLLLEELKKEGFFL